MFFFECSGRCHVLVVRHGFLRFSGRSRSIRTFPLNRQALTIDGKKHQVNAFPYETRVKREFTDTEVKVESEGYDPVRFTIFKTFNAVSVINLFDLLGWGIDAATELGRKPDQRAYEIMFAEPKANATE